MAIRVIIAGAGARGNDWLREVQADPDCRIVACADIDAKARELAGARWHIPAQFCFADLDQAIEQVECEAVIIATPPEHHARNCESVISFGRAVLVEKPFTLNLKDAVRIVKLAEEAHTPIVVGQNYRYLRSFRTCRRVVREGLLGRIGIVMLQYYRVPHEMANWLTQSEFNVLWGIAVHHLDALRFMLHQEVTGVMAESFCVPWSQPAGGSSIQLLLKFDRDTHGTYAASYESSGHEFFERGQEFYARLMGELGTLHVFQRWLMLCPKGKLPRLVRRGPRSVTEEAVLLRQLKEALSSGQEPESSGRDNLQTMAIVEACVQSATQHRWTDPQELLGNSR